jgi:hypothetical protein
MSEQSSAPVVPNFNNKVDTIVTKFNFRSQKVLDDQGKEIDTTKRPSVELSLKLLTLEGVAAILTSGSEKSQDLLLEAVREVQLQAARDIVNEKEDISDANFPMANIDWDFLANQPKESRRGGGIPKEVWEEFAADYLAVMPGATGKSSDIIANHVKALTARFQTVKTSKVIVQKLRDGISMYATVSANAEQFTDVLKFLDKKAAELLAKDLDHVF